MFIFLHTIIYCKGGKTQNRFSMREKNIYTQWYINYVFLQITCSVSELFLVSLVCSYTLINTFFLYFETLSSIKIQVKILLGNTFLQKHLEQQGKSNNIFTRQLNTKKTPIHNIRVFPFQYANS